MELWKIFLQFENLNLPMGRQMCHTPLPPPPRNTVNGQECVGRKHFMPNNLNQYEMFDQLDYLSWYWIDRAQIWHWERAFLDFTSKTNNNIFV